MTDTSWYPANYYIQPEYASYPIISYWDQEDFERRRRKYWDAAWTRALQRWEAVGLDLHYFARMPGCLTHGVSVSVVDVPPGIGGWTEYHYPPVCSTIQIDITTWRNAVASRVINVLTGVICHEVGHSLGFGHGGTGIMRSAVEPPYEPNAEEIAAAQAYWFA